jgi:DNA-directed RNA polymerase subunit K/omega
VLLAAARARELAAQHKTTLNYNPATHALLEAQEGKIGKHYLRKVIPRE